jgi:molybdenum cofactor cytidylyltransferase
MTGIIILAAGSSSRMGQPKQQLVFEDKTLIQHAIESAVKSLGSPVIVVLGANQGLIKPHIAHERVHFVINPEWQQGMSTSVHAGIKALQSQYPQVDDVIFMLCDQPFVNENLLNRIINVKAEAATPIVACAYQNTIGPPALFNKQHFAELLALKGQEGAKKLLYKYADQVSTIPFPEGSIDIDTPEDYQNLKTS